jgi:hypothetical protein
LIYILSPQKTGMTIIIACDSAKNAFPYRQSLSTVYPFNLACLAMASHAGIHINSISIHNYIVARVASPILREPLQVLAINPAIKSRNKGTHQGQQFGAPKRFSEFVGLAEIWQDLLPGPKFHEKIPNCCEA